MNRVSSARLNYILAILMLLIIPAAFAQSDLGTIVGFAKDPTGAVIPNTKITIKNEATNEEHTVTTNEAGYYTVPNLQPGAYTMVAEAPGFKRFESNSNRLTPNSTLSLDATMAVGAVTESVVVSATASQLQTESGAIEKNVTTQQIESLEINGRNPLYMASLVPGIRTSNTMGDLHYSLDSGGYNINGSRVQDTIITFDGAPAVRTRANGTSIAVADTDSTQEMQILTGDYAAEYGRAAGGQIRIITKSGSRDFHGAAYEYFRNSAMNANTWTRNQSVTTNFTSPFRYNQFGFDVGGPVFIPKIFNTGREKLFFFVGQEWVRYRYTDTQTQEVPTTLMRQGNFSELLGPNIFYNKPEVIYDPATCPSVGASTCTPFAGNIIPASRLSKNGIAIIDAYPGPTPNYISGNQNWIAQAAHPINQRKGTYNGDFLPSDRHHIELRRTDFSYYEYQPFDQGSGLTPKYFNRPNQTNTVSWTWTLSPTLLNEARATYSLDVVHIPVNTAAPGFNAQSLGINYPYLLPQGKDIPSKIPTVVVPNFYGLAGGPYPSHSTGPIFTAADSITWVKGSHTFKFGYYFERSGENDGDQINVNTVPGGSSNQNGTFQFTDARTGLGATSGVGIANLALGLADSYTEIGPRAYTIYRGFLNEFFAQDSYKVNQKLHLDYGFRETITQPYKALWGNQIFFDPEFYNPSQAVSVDPKTGNVIAGSGNIYNGMVIPGSGWPSDAVGHGVTQAATSAYNSLFRGVPDYFQKIESTPQPRAGLAYQINDKTVLRAGIGAFVTHFGLFDNIFPGANSPFQPFVTVANVNVDNPPASLAGGATPPLTVTTEQRNMKPAESWSWNATVQRQFFFGTVLEIGYVGRRAYHLPEAFDINQPTAGAL